MDLQASLRRSAALRGPGPPKRGFEVPVDTWLRGPLRPMFEAVVLDSNSGGGDLINRDMARRLYQAHVSGAGRHGVVLWSLLILTCWSDRYLGPDAMHLACTRPGVGS